MKMVLPSDLLIGKFAVVDKKKGDTITARDVRPADRERHLAALALGADRSLGDALIVGLCVDVWSAGAPTKPVAVGLKVATVLPFAPDGKRLIFFSLPASQHQVAGALLSAKEPALSIGPCDP